MPSPTGSSPSAWHGKDSAQPSRKLIRWRCAAQAISGKKVRHPIPMARLRRDDATLGIARRRWSKAAPRWRSGAHEHEQSDVVADLMMAARMRAATRWSSARPFFQHSLASPTSAATSPPRIDTRRSTIRGKSNVTRARLPRGPGPHRSSCTAAPRACRVVRVKPKRRLSVLAPARRVMADSVGYAWRSSRRCGRWGRRIEERDGARAGHGTEAPRLEPVSRRRRREGSSAVSVPSAQAASPAPLYGAARGEPTATRARPAECACAVWDQAQAENANSLMLCGSRRRRPARRRATAPDRPQRCIGSASEAACFSPYVDSP